MKKYNNIFCSLIILFKKLLKMLNTWIDINLIKEINVKNKINRENTDTANLIQQADLREMW